MVFPHFSNISSTSLSNKIKNGLPSYQAHLTNQIIVHEIKPEIQPKKKIPQSIQTRIFLYTDQKMGQLKNKY